MLLDSLTLTARGYIRVLLEGIAHKARGGQSTGSLWQTLLIPLFLQHWVYLSAVRGELLTGRGIDGLNIIALKAQTTFTHEADDITRKEIRINVAADEGMHSHFPMIINATTKRANDPGTLARESEDVIGQMYTPTATWFLSNANAVQNWYTGCRINHPECSQTFSQSQTLDDDDVQLPTRCLEVSRDGPEADAAYQYVLSNTSGQRGKYITLSHRWGDDAENCKTTVGTLQCIMGACDQTCSQCTGVIPRITTLFQDAVKLTVALGVKYLWIDSIASSKMATTGAERQLKWQIITNIRVSPSPPPR